MSLLGLAKEHNKNRKQEQKNQLAEKKLSKEQRRKGYHYDDNGVLRNRLGMRVVLDKETATDEVTSSSAKTGKSSSPVPVPGQGTRGVLPQQQQAQAVQVPAPTMQQAAAPAQISSQVPAVSANTAVVVVQEHAPAKAASGYYPELQPHERVAKLAQDGYTNEQIALRLDIGLKSVVELKKLAKTKTLIQSPRELFSARLVDFNEAFEYAKKNFYDDPESEVSYKVMTEFMRTMRELIKDHNELDNPQEIAQQITMQALQPLVESVLTTVVNVMKLTVKNISPYLRDHERATLESTLTSGLRTLQTNINADYNKSVASLERMFDVDLSKLHAKEKQAVHVQEGTSVTTEQVTDQTTSSNADSK